MGLSRLLTMRSHDEHKNVTDSDSYRELRLLEEIEDAPEISQRDLSQRLGIALGLTNTMLRNLAKKGFIRASQAGWKRWLYAITPEGFSHKLRLTISYVRRVLDDYGKIRQALRLELAPLALHGESQVAICGTGDFAELVFLGLKDIGIEEIDIYGPDPKNNPRFLGIAVRATDTLRSGQYDKVVIADLKDSAATFETLIKQGLPADALVTFYSNAKVNNGVKEAK